MPERQVEVGKCEEAINGDEYEATFSGTGWLSGVQDEEGVTDMSGAEFSERLRLNTRDPDKHPYPRIRILTLPNLFPDGWSEAEVEYEITVRAKKLPPNP